MLIETSLENELTNISCEMFPYKVEYPEFKAVRTKNQNGTVRWINVDIIGGEIPGFSTEFC